MIKKLMGTTANILVGSEVMGVIGSSGIPFSNVTQSMVGLGVLGNATSLLKKKR